MPKGRELGFFSNNSATPASAPGTLAPLSKDRIKAALEAEGFSYSVDSDGDIGGGWEYGTFYFFVQGNSDELLCIRGAWRARLSAESFTQAAMLCNQWNMEKLWPKTYARLVGDNEEEVMIFTELNIDLEQGATEDMLKQQINCAVSTSMQFFESMNEAFPAEWEKAKPE